MAGTETRFLRIKDVLDSVALSRATLYRLVNNGDFPQPVKVGNSTMWVQKEVDDWMRLKVASRAKVHVLD